jgi:hypothetical protein
MDSTAVAWMAVALLLLAAPALLILRDWRWILGLLAAAYLAMFVLVLRHWPVAMAVAKLVTGWMGVVTLGMTRLGLSMSEETHAPLFVEGATFRLLSAGIVVLAAVSAAGSVEEAIPGIGLPVIIGGLTLIGSGLFHLGMTSDPLRVTVGLLTTLAGFEALYAAVETSVLVAALLAASSLGLSLVGSYLMTQASPEEEPEEPL